MRSRTNLVIPREGVESYSIVLEEKCRSLNVIPREGVERDGPVRDGPEDLERPRDPERGS